MRHELFGKYLEPFSRIDAVVMTGAIDAHHFLFQTTLYLSYAEALYHVVA